MSVLVSESLGRHQAEDREKVGRQDMGPHGFCSPSSLTNGWIPGPPAF